MRTLLLLASLATAQLNTSPPVLPPYCQLSIRNFVADMSCNQSMSFDDALATLNKLAHDHDLGPYLASDYRSLMGGRVWKFVLAKD